MDVPDHGHEPVLLNAVMNLLSPRSGQVALDCTVGRGGHALALAQAVIPGGLVLCVDVDPDNLAYARERLGQWRDNCRYFQANFAQAGEVLQAAGIAGVDMLLADFGVSTNQLTQDRHGLSFSVDAPLDMRLDPELTITAADLIAKLPEKELADMLFTLAQERWSRRIARRIVQVRQTTPISTTRQLAELVRQVVPPEPGRHKIDPATKTFQALRMAVNAELDNLGTLLEQVPQFIKPGGRAAFISFHSGEDRLVKHAMLEWQAQNRCRVLTKKPVMPDEVEIEANPRCRSARLRAAEFAVSTGVPPQ
jgi:16S rRNA (cytosine1402-N4)-methyltransferase